VAQWLCWLSGACLSPNDSCLCPLGLQSLLEAFRSSGGEGLEAQASAADVLVMGVCCWPAADAPISLAFTPFLSSDVELKPPLL